MGNDHDVCRCGCGAEHLTARQAEIVSLAAAGLTADQAAQCLGIATSTVQTHLRTMRQRAQARNGVELVARAFAAGILVPGSWPPPLSDHRCLAVRWPPGP
jgi:DNA-binding CsgD family transcriptional regulator